MLGTGQEDLRAFLDAAIAVDTIRHHAYLEPARAELGDAIGEFHRVDRIERLPAAQHDVVIVAECFAQRAHQYHILAHPAVTAHRAVAKDAADG